MDEQQEVCLQRCIDTRTCTNKVPAIPDDLKGATRPPYSAEGTQTHDVTDRCLVKGGSMERRQEDGGRGREEREGKERRREGRRKEERRGRRGKEKRGEERK